MTEEPAAAERQPGVEISVGTLAWIAAGTVFVALRLAGVMSIPIGGVELEHLSGAWQAHAGNADGRFVPTLFQAIVAGTFAFTSSEAPARALALLASCSVPFALYRLRAQYGEAGAMAVLLLLAFDPITLLLGSTAWAGALDLPLVLWLLVLMHQLERPSWVFAVAGFLVATAGPLVLPLVVGFALVRLFRQHYSARQSALCTGGGVLLGLVLAATGFGTGLQDPVLPPILALAHGFEANLSTESTGFLALAYSAPLIALGLAAAVYRATECWREETWPEDTAALLVSAALALAWVLLAAGSHDPAPLGAAAIPLALLLGRELPSWLARLRTVDWRYAAPALAGMAAAALIAEAYTVDWARIDRVGKDRDQLIVTGLVIAAVACGGILASNRRTAAALFLPVGAVAAFLMLTGATNVAFGGPNEPLPSPISTIQGREIRDIALETRAAQRGLIVIHADFEQEATWPFRDSGDLVFASRVPPDASVLVWPATEPAPEGFAILDGQWSLEEQRTGPDGGFLDYLRWLTNRNSLKNTPVPVTVYLRTTP